MNRLSLYHNADQMNRKIILGQIEKNSEARLIDLGCGDGAFALELAERAGTKEIYGIEFLNDSCHTAKERGIRISSADLNGGFPFGDESFDIVHANQVLEHLSGTDSFVREVYRILKPGGYAVVSTPNLASLHNIFSLLLGKQPFSAHISNEIILGNSLDPKHGMRHKSRGEVHLRIFTPESLREIFEHYGFIVEQLVGVGYYPLPGRLAAFFSRIDAAHSVYLTAKARKAKC